MEKLTFEKSFIIAKPKSEKIELATEMFECYGRTVRYPVILKLINEKGVQYIRELVQELQKQGICNWKLICWNANKTKVMWYESPKEYHGTCSKCGADV